MVLSKHQSAALSEFCNDIAKGFFLGVGANLILASGFDFAAKLTISLLGVIAALLFLYFTLVFAKLQDTYESQ